jgi:hypothetical protein
MPQTRRMLMLMTALLSAGPLLPQDQGGKSKVVLVLTPDEIRAINEPREMARKELFADYLQFDPPDITNPLGDSGILVAIVTVRGVEPPDNNKSPYFSVELQVEQLLRGESELTELHAESRWGLPRPRNDGLPLSGGGPHKTVFDLIEPKVGNRYVVGYSILNEAQGRAYISGAIDLNDHNQDQVFSDLKRFLRIESAANGSNFGPLVAALNDQVTWIRDLAARRLVQLDTCNASPSCEEGLLTSASHLLRSKKLLERWEALMWLDPLTQPIGDRKDGPNGLPTMSGATVRELLVSALSDSNVVIADKAFGELELFDFYHASEPGECIEIVPALRKSARWTAEEAKGVMIGGHNFASAFSCNPGQASSGGN